MSKIIEFEVEPSRITLLIRKIGDALREENAENGESLVALGVAFEMSKIYEDGRVLELPEQTRAQIKRLARKYRSGGRDEVH